MPTLPSPLKRALLPIWNRGHQLARRLAEYADAFRHRRIQRCEVCGRLAPMLLRPRAIPDELRRRWGLTPGLADALVRKETLDCAACGAKLRARRIARVLLELYPTGSPPGPAPSLAVWAASPEARRLRIAEINTIDGLHAVLSGLPGLVASDFHEPGQPQTTGVRHEDLAALSYQDASFDLVLTSETLEHVPDLPRALAEIRRILTPEGRHVFTIPVLPSTPSTFARARLGPDGSFLPLAPFIAHPGGDRGYPVFTEFGADLPDLMRAAGFDLDVHHGPNSPDDLAQVYVATPIHRSNVRRSDETPASI
ncbi:methyltransferase domain-containing protein [Isosphaeraceae bacterium EP7]